MYVNNPTYATTNYIYSIHLARKLARDDILLIHGDVVTEKTVCRKLIACEHSNAVVIREPEDLPEKDFKARIASGRVSEIGVSVGGEGTVFLLPFYKLSKEAMDIWLAEIGSFVSAGNTGVYAEEAFNRVSHRIGLAPLIINKNEICMEVDDALDLMKAWKLLHSSLIKGSNN
jgi:choline kinase